MRTRESLTAEELKRQLHYDPETGVFTWIVANCNRVKIGAAAGCLRNGYVCIHVAGWRHEAHRLAWLYMHGEWPENDVDHRNMDRADNRICNLRLATRTQNLANRKAPSNNRSGFKGVYYAPAKRKYVAQCGVAGRQHYLGAFSSPELAAKAYRVFAEQHHGEFYNTYG